MSRLAKHLGGHSGKTHCDRGALTWLRDKRGVRKLLDLGCGPMGQVKLARSLGIYAMGIDGDPACKPDFIHDFNQDIPQIDEEFDAVWCVEFLEHVAEKFLPNVLAAIEQANPKVMVVSAAPPGKKGYHHVNCRPPAYWYGVFAATGYKISEELTEEVRASSTMHREFVRDRGMVFLDGL